MAPVITPGVISNCLKTKLIKDILNNIYRKTNEMTRKWKLLNSFALINFEKKNVSSNFTEHLKFTR